MAVLVISSEPATFGRINMVLSLLKIERNWYPYSINNGVWEKEGPLSYVQRNIKLKFYIWNFAKHRTNTQVPDALLGPPTGLLVESMPGTTKASFYGKNGSNSMPVGCNLYSLFVTMNYSSSVSFTFQQHYLLQF